MTAKYKRLSCLFGLLSICAFIGPILYYVIKAFITCELTTQKVALAFSVVVVLILTLIALVNKYTLRSRIWVLIIGLYVCLDNIMTALIIVAVCQVLDELILTPLCRYYRNLYRINKEIDKRS